MARPIYSYELTDPDFSWLISNFKENNPHYAALESSSLPIVFISSAKSAKPAGDESDEQFEVVPAPVETKKGDRISETK